MSLWKNIKQCSGLTAKDPELNRSHYSLVSGTELTGSALQLWHDLPEEVKNDEALAPFKQLCEKGVTSDNTTNGKKNDTKFKRIPLVKSEPILGDDVETANKKEPEVTENSHKDIEKCKPVTTVTNPRDAKISKAKYYIKTTILLGCWMFSTLIFMTHDVKKDVTTISSVSSSEVKEFTFPILHQTTFNPLVLTIKMVGPFLSEPEQIKLNDSDRADKDRLEVWIERAGGYAISDIWLIYLKEDQDFVKGEPLLATLLITTNDTEDITYTIKIKSSSNETTPFAISYKFNAIDGGVGVIYACVLLAGLYVLIVFEVINRTMAAISVSTMSLAALAIAGERPSLPEVISWLDEETLLLLFSMMMLVAIMAETGIFDFLAVFTFQVTKGKLWPLIYLLCTITAILSTILDNVTTVLLMSPVTIRLCEVMELDPVPILMFMSIYSNVGGTATPVGDPPNVIVVSNKAVVDAGINFTNFTAHMLVGILAIYIQTSLQIRYIFRDSNKLRLSVPREIQELSHQIAIWRRAADSLPHLSQDVRIVRERLERKIQKLTVQRDSLAKKASKRACPKETFQSTLINLKEKYKIRDKVLLMKTSVAVAFVVIVFFLHSIPDLNRVSLGWTALLGAILLLTLADREDLEPILRRVEWSTLLFFAALFVLMEALSKLGLILYIGGLMELLILKVDEGARLAVAIMLILWVSGMISGFVDNIPLTTMMIRVVLAIGSNPTLNLPLSPLIWALLFGACLGGNGTLIGSSASVVCAGVAEQHGYKFTFSRFFKIGFPIMIGHLVVASAYLLICHCVFSWH
ncbi:P protein [Manduca sexta]|uniref:Citrate transporter-like domain-containing protein n=1 Tax=Manduca sexta TaxID=7130 RepID=A0A922CZX2_MANSE|nr:P protein [Manduca sexta]XP_030037961.1 P protein [Manduca sexta]XP_037300430.1 P protein [Manduca sexta]KAG6464899.1 hypothetical protein O3G_MSEX014799 [Manduca sexta]